MPNLLEPSSMRTRCEYPMKPATPRKEVEVQQQCSYQNREGRVLGEMPDQALHADMVEHVEGRRD